MHIARRTVGPVHRHCRTAKTLAAALGSALAFALFSAGAAPARPVAPLPTYTLPTIDLSHDIHRQVIVDREAGQYLGHPTTVLLEDGKTMLVVYPKGHGRGAIVYKRSRDGGRTWSERLPTPLSWETSHEVPTLHRVIDPQGKKRIILFSGLYPIRMAVTEDDGTTWSELKPIGNFGGVVTMASVISLKTGPGHYAALFHDDGRFLRGGADYSSAYGSPLTKAKGPPKFVVYQTVSTDGGLTWGQPVAIATHPTAHLCEPGAIRSPDGKQIAVLLRENSRKHNSFVIFSGDEGRTWTPLRELPAALTGDRHTGRYAPDGRLFITFRDTTLSSSTKGDWVGWVGTYEDIARGREGQYRVRLMQNFKGGDCAYPGLELLPDGTFVTTTYGHWVAGEEPFIASVRFKLTELDAQAARLPQQVALFKKGEAGYHTCRIPSLIVTKKGTVLAFCEGRQEGAGDAGNIDLVLKRSSDGGKTWGDLQVIWNEGGNTCGNPCPVVDQTTGTIWLLLTHNLGTDKESDIIKKKAQSTRTVWACRSDDDGRTWTAPVNITATTKDPGWGWYATGPGVGIQIRQGPHRGRLVIPCDNSYDDPQGKVNGGPYEYGAHVIYSDDHGTNWVRGGLVRPKVNECQVVEVADGRGTLLMNLRSYFGRNRRTHALSRDGGGTWTSPADVPELIEPVCQASILRYSWPAGGGKSRLLFANPASMKRERLTVRLSYDEGATWPVAREVFFGPSAYSGLAVLPDKTIGCLYERGGASAYENITFARFTLDWLTEGKDKGRH